jgi:hypothetical protein
MKADVIERPSGSSSSTIVPMLVSITACFPRISSSVYGVVKNAGFADVGAVGRGVAGRVACPRLAGVTGRGAGACAWAVTAP